MRTRRSVAPGPGYALALSPSLLLPLLPPLLIAAACTVGCGSQPDDGAVEATIELTDCRAGMTEAKCGVLEVEQDRETPGGRTIGLQIIVAPATSRTHRPDPVFLLVGGPGQGAAEIAPMILQRFDAIRREHDMVFVDVRGTGKSSPLKCALEDPENLELLLGADMDLDKIDACLADYAEQGVDVSRYSTAEIVDDLDEVRAALGYGQVNLFGISYGTLVAQVWMRRHGEHVRSAVLDGVVPTDLPVVVRVPANSERALQKVLADCREHPDCAAAFPGLERKLATVLTDLETNRALEEFVHPRTGERTRVEITRPGFVNVIGGMLYSGTLTTLLPLMIERAHAGDFGPTAALSLRMARMSESMSMGLYLTIGCTEEFADLDEATRREAVAGLDVFDDYVLAQHAQACSRWPKAGLAPDFHAPIDSDVPTLILSGRYDPVTPAIYGEHVGEQLGNARHVVVDAVSHGVWHNGCAPELIAEFFVGADPAAIDPECFDTLSRPPVFVTPNGPLPARPAEPSAARGPSLAEQPPSDAPELGTGGETEGTELAHGELMHGGDSRP